LISTLKGFHSGKSKIKTNKNVTKREIELTEKGKEIHKCLKKIASIVELIKA